MSDEFQRVRRVNWSQGRNAFYAFPGRQWVDYRQEGDTIVDRNDDNTMSVRRTMTLRVKEVRPQLVRIDHHIAAATTTATASTGTPTPTWNVVLEETTRRGRRWHQQQTRRLFSFVKKRTTTTTRTRRLERLSGEESH